MVATKTKSVVQGTSPTWSVSATGFVTQSGTVDNIQADTVLPTVYLLGEINGVKEAQVGYYTSGYLTTSGELYLCGMNGNGQQGNGTTTDVTTFTKRASNVKQCSIKQSIAGYLNENNELYLCGMNGGSAIDTSGTAVTTFTKRADNVKEFLIPETYSYGQCVLWLTTTGDLYGVGGNVKGQLGAGNVTNINTPRLIASNVKKVTCDRYGYATWYITESGDLYGAGNNESGQQGTGSYGSNQKVTTFAKRASNVVNVFPTVEGCWYVNNSGELYGCGSGKLGQQGNGSSGNNNYVTTFTKRADNVKKIICDLQGQVTWYVNTSGELYGCGIGSYGNQGDGNSSSHNVTTFTKRADNIKDVFLGNQLVTWYITNDGDLYGCGYNSDGQQGSGDTTTVTTFTKRAENVKDVILALNGNNICYINTSGELYICGDNASGQQGNGTTTDVTTFTKRADNVKNVFTNIIYANFDTWYITTSGDLYGTGDNYYGQQGSGDTTNVTTFTKRVTGSVNTANITITPTPADATVTINSEEVSTADIRKGMPVEWSVSKTGYVTQTGSIDHIYDDTTLTITLEEE